LNDLQTLVEKVNLTPQTAVTDTIKNLSNADNSK